MPKTNPFESKATNTDEIIKGTAEALVTDKPEVVANPQDTARIEAGEPTKTEKTKPENPIPAWNEQMISLNENIVKKEDIVKQLSELYKVEKKDRSPEQIKEISDLEKNKKDLSWKVLERECGIAGKDFKKVREELEKKEKEEYEKGIAEAFGKDSYKEQEKKAQEMRKKREMRDILLVKLKGMSGAEQRKYGISAEDLDDKQKANRAIEKFYKTASENIYKATADDQGKDGIIVSPEAFCEMTKQRLEPENIGNAGFWRTVGHAFEGGLLTIPLTDRSNVPNKKDRTIIKTMTHKQLNDLATQYENDFKKVNSNASESEFRKFAEAKWEENKETHLKELEQYLLDLEIAKTRKDILEKQEKIMPEPQKEKLEEAGKISNEERKIILEDLRNKRRDLVKREKKIEEIRKALEEGEKTGEYKATTKDKKRLKGEAAKLAMINLGKELMMKNQDLSEDIIKNADKLSGRDLVKEAREMKKMKREEKQAWITKEVQRILSKQKREADKKEEIIKLEDKDTEVVGEPAEEIPEAILPPEEEPESSEHFDLADVPIRAEKPASEENSDNNVQNEDYEKRLKMEDMERQAEEYANEEINRIRKEKGLPLLEFDDLMFDVAEKLSKDEYSQWWDIYIHKFSDLDLEARRNKAQQEVEKETGAKKSETERTLLESNGFKVGEKVHWIVPEDSSSSLFPDEGPEEFEIVGFEKNIFGDIWVKLKNPKYPSENYSAQINRIEKIQPEWEESLEHMGPEPKPKEGFVRRAWNSIIRKK